jgi:hypothetical protein
VVHPATQPKSWAAIRQFWQGRDTNARSIGSPDEVIRPVALPGAIIDRLDLQVLGEPNALEEPLGTLSGTVRFEC